MELIEYKKNKNKKRKMMTKKEIKSINHKTCSDEELQKYFDDCKHNIKIENENLVCKNKDILITNFQHLRWMYAKACERIYRLERFRYKTTNLLKESTETIDNFIRHSYHNEGEMESAIDGLMDLKPLLINKDDEKKIEDKMNDLSMCRCEGLLEDIEEVEQNIQECIDMKV